MIGKLTGQVDTQGEDWVLIDVGGVGYEVFCSGRTLSALPNPGGAATLMIATHVREDHIHLYGFADEAEKAWFERLQSVQGVGARMALAILSILPPEDIGNAIARHDKKAITQAPGVGGKLAERIINELKDKVAKLTVAPGAAPAAAAAPATGQEAVMRDAVSALVHLGYRETEVRPYVSEALQAAGPEASLDAVIRETLKGLAPTGTMTR